MFVYLHVKRIHVNLCVTADANKYVKQIYTDIRIYAAAIMGISLYVCMWILAFVRKYIFNSGRNDFEYFVHHNRSEPENKKKNLLTSLEAISESFVVIISVGEFNIVNRKIAIGSKNEIKVTENILTIKVYYYVFFSLPVNCCIGMKRHVKPLVKLRSTFKHIHLVFRVGSAAITSLFEDQFKSNSIDSTAKVKYFCPLFDGSE